MSSKNVFKRATKQNLTDYRTFDPKTIVFTPMADKKDPTTVGRVSISVPYKDGSLGDLIFLTERLFSFGPGENKFKDNPMNGYSLPLSLLNRENPSEGERAWLNTFNATVDAIKNYLVSHRDEIGKYELELTDLKNFNPVYYKKDKGKIVEGATPSLYPKLIAFKDKNDPNKWNIQTKFTTNTGIPLNPVDVLGKRGYAVAAIKIESVFVGQKLSLQVKVMEVRYEVLDTEYKSLLPPPTIQATAFDDDENDESSIMREVVTPSLSNMASASASASSVSRPRKPSLEDDESVVPAQPVQTQPVEKPKRRVGTRVQL